MLIGIDASRSVVRPRTGTEAYSFHLIGELLELDSPHRFRLYFNSPPASGELESPRAEHVVMPAPRLWTHARLSSEMLRRPPDLLFVPSHVLPVARPRRAVATVHDLGYLHWPRAHSRSRWWYLHLSTQFNARVSRLVIADSAATRDDLVHAYRIPEDKIRIVHLGCSPRFRPISADAECDIRARYGLSEPYLLAVGTLQPRKNLARLFDAFTLARSSLPAGYRLVVVGAPGYAATEVGRRAEQLGDSVRFLGYVPEADLPALLGAATALAFPSLYEGFGLPAVEAMACGTPVIVSNTSSLPEVVGDAGRLVDPTGVDDIARGLVEVASDPALREAMRGRGLARAKEFTWRRCASSALRVLEEASRV
jgi:glycosyltransferase involved in cell wall biosynthesis